MARWATAIAVAGALGCASVAPVLPTLPTRHTLRRDQLLIYSDSRLPKQHRLVEDLAQLRDDVVTTLELPSSDEPIHVYLFSSQEPFQQFLKLHYPGLPPRRAIFVESDTRLAVYAHWGDRVAEDLRHEVAHGYLHSVVPNLPLWLDEGLAEFFEVPRGEGGAHAAHLEQLGDELRRGWRPDLPRLERLTTIEQMNQLDYAEAWAWVHFLLSASPKHREFLVLHLRELRKSGTVEPLSQVIALRWSDPARLLEEHLRRLAAR